MSTTTNIFEQASKSKLRFRTTKGLISTEDLWELKLEDLDSIAKSLNKEIKESSEESFITKRTSANKTLELAFEIVKHIIEVKLEEKEARVTAAAKRAKRAKLLEAIEEQENLAFRTKSLDELKKELSEIDEE